MSFDPATLNLIITISTGLAAAFVVALWLSLIFWAWRDVRSRTRDVFMRTLSMIVVIFLFLPGILIYLILRPPRKIEEEYQNTLEEEALLQSIEEHPYCPGCGRKVQEEWLACPSCYTRLKKRCTSCDKLMELTWNLCPYCAAPVPGFSDEENTSGSDSAPASSDGFSLPEDEAERQIL